MFFIGVYQKEMYSSTPLNDAAGCFLGTCKVLMDDGEWTEVRHVNPGDVVAGGHKVIALVKVGMDVESVKMSKVVTDVGTCVLSPWHPYLIGDTWVVGQETVGSEDVPTNTVYNFVLESGHIVDIEGVRCCTFAHGFTGPVIEHPFFGTNAIIEELKFCQGWAAGRPSYENCRLIRKDGVVTHWFEATKPSA